MITRKYTPEEALNEIKLRMIYDSSKTLNENVSILVESDTSNYYNTRVQQLMKNPDNSLFNLNFGNPTVNKEQAANTIKTAVEGLGTSTEPLNYIINKALKTLADSVAIVKVYPSIAGESLFDALNGEWFDGGAMEKITSKIANQLKTWCQSSPNNKKNVLCQELTDDELKYGKY